MNFNIVYASDLDELMGDKNVILVDIRPKNLYEVCHIQEAISMPFDEIESYESVLERNKKYVFYCQYGGSSMKLARYLGNRGYFTATVIGGYVALAEYLKKVGPCDKINR